MAGPQLGRNQSRIASSSRDLAPRSDPSPSNYGRSGDGRAARASTSRSFSPQFPSRSLSPSPRLTATTLGVATDTDLLDASANSSDQEGHRHTRGSADSDITDKPSIPGSAPIQTQRRFGSYNRSAVSLTGGTESQHQAPSGKSVRHRASFLNLLRPRTSKPKLHISSPSASNSPPSASKSVSATPQIPPLPLWQSSEPTHRPSSEADLATHALSAQGLGLDTFGQQPDFRHSAALTSGEAPSGLQAYHPHSTALGDAHSPMHNPATRRASTNAMTQGPPPSMSGTEPVDTCVPTASPPGPSSSTSLRDIRKSVLHKAAMPNSTSESSLQTKTASMPFSPSVDTALTALEGSSRTAHSSQLGWMQPRSAGGTEPEEEDVHGTLRHVNGQVAGDGGEDAAAEDGEHPDVAQRRRAAKNSRRMTMLDFLSTAPPDDVLANATTPGPSRLTVPAAAVASPHSATLPRRPPYSSVASPIDDGPRSPRRRPQSMITQSPTRRRAASQESREADGPITMLDFLSDAQVQGERSASQAQQGSKTRTSRKEEELKIVVTPITDTLTMFGSTQTSANYSLSGVVSVSLPRPVMKPALAREERSAAPSPSPVVEAGSSATWNERRSSSDHRAQAESGNASQQSLHPPTIIKSLTLTFAGYSIYADHSGRYSGIRLCEVKQDLLRGGATLPLESDLQSSVAPTSTEPLTYEIQFDVTVPGWLPASACSRFGASFYSVSATALVLDDASHGETTNSSWRGDAPRCESPEALRSTSTNATAAVLDVSTEDAVRQHVERRQRSDPTESPLARPGTSHANTPAVAGSSDLQNAGPSTVVSRVPTVKQKGKGGSWLSRRAKQLSLKGRSNSPPQEEEEAESHVARQPSEGPVSTSSGSENRKIRVHRPDRPGRTRLADGSVILRSNKQLIIIKRCRDVVPVPVARMAIVGDHLPEEAQDAPSIDRNSASQTTADSHDPTRGGSGRNATIPGAPAAQIHSPVVSDGSLDSSAAAPIAVAPSSIAASRIPEETNVTDRGIDSGTAGTTSASDDPSPARAEQAEQANEALTQTPRTTPPNPPPLPVAPSVFNAPTDPAKLNAAARLPSAPARTSSAAALSPDGTPVASEDASAGTNGSRGSGRGGPPMRHFLHRPILHPPTDSGIEDSDGLPFSLTISVPSHIQVQNANVLTFGVQVEVGRTASWSKVRELGGLRLRDMELVCLQTERHTSIPSRTFCATFPVPPEPKIVARDLPVLPEFTPPMNKRPVQSSQEVRVRSAYDQQAVCTSIHLLENGRPVPPEVNNVERTRTLAVGPPPSFQKDQQSRPEKQHHQKDKQGPAMNEARRGDRARDRIRDSDAAGAPHPPSSAGREDPQRQNLFGDQGHHISDRGDVVASSHTSGAQLATVTASDSTLHAQTPSVVSPDTRTSAADHRRQGQPQPGRSASQGGLSSLLPPAPANGPRSTSPSRSGPRGETEASVSRTMYRPVQTQVGDGSPMSEEAAAFPGSSSTSRRGGRGRRAYEATMRGLSAFANAMMDVGYDENTTSGQQANGDPATLERDQPRASYSFGGEDGNGVDLTKGRIRMTVNLPLVSSSASAARRDNTPQLVSDYESPHMRIRHKLKVKLSFGFGAKPLGGDGDWGQALMMCVPVRFSEAPPKEVREQFAPLPITVTSNGENGPSTIQPQISMSNTNAVPVLPAYTQLFRDDGSRLNEAEDLPAYPGPRRPAISSRTSRPTLHSRGSVTGPLSPRLDGGGSFEGSGGGVTADPGTPGTVPLLNSLAPEQILDDAIQGLTDPDESRAAIREQERELREMQEASEDLASGEGGGSGVLGGVEINDENDDDDLEGHGSAREEDTVVMDGTTGGDGHEDRMRAMEEELGI